MIRAPARARFVPPLLAAAPGLHSRLPLRFLHTTSPHRDDRLHPLNCRLPCSVYHFTILVSAQAAGQARAQLTARTDGEAGREVRIRGGKHRRRCPRKDELLLLSLLSLICLVTCAAHPDTLQFHSQCTHPPTPHDDRVHAPLHSCFVRAEMFPYRTPVYVRSSIHTLIFTSVHSCPTAASSRRTR